MENELNKLIEQQNKEYEKEALGHDDDDAQSNADIDDFEQRLKMNKSQMGFDDSDDDDDFSYKKASKSPVKKPEYNYNPPKQTRPLLSDEPDLLKQVQEMHQNKNKSATKPSKSSDTQSEVIKQKQDMQQKAEEEKALEILSSNNASLKDKKLKELIQKNKELYVNLEKEKTMRQKLQKDIERIKEETDMHLAVMEGKPKTAKQQQDENDWKKKYIDLEKKLQESKLLNTTMKNDLNKAMRVISKEIGENVNIDTILSQENSWKGRAQQIEVLKARVKELQAKVAGPGNFSDISYITDKSQEMAGMGGDRATSRSTSLVGGKPKERREEMEALKAQVDSLKAENDSLVEKVKALSSRKTILEKDIKDCKNEFERAKQILIDKSENDDKYIAALKREVEKSRMASPTIQTRIVYRDKPQEVKKVEPDEAEDNTMAKKELNILKNELDKREKIIKELINEKLKHEANNMHRENIIQENISEGEKIVKLETMIKILKQENEELSNVKLGIKTTTPDSKIIKDLSLQNAQLRRKVDDLQTKLKAYQ